MSGLSKLFGVYSLRLEKLLSKGYTVDLAFETSTPASYPMASVQGYRKHENHHNNACHYRTPIFFRLPCAALAMAMHPYRQQCQSSPLELRTHSQVERLSPFSSCLPRFLSTFAIPRRIPTHTTNRRPHQLLLAFVVPLLLTHPLPLHPLILSAH